jgi:carboxyl-terminal processing protease
MTSDIPGAGDPLGASTTPGAAPVDPWTKPSPAIPTASVDPAAPYAWDPATGAPSAARYPAPGAMSAADGAAYPGAAMPVAPLATPADPDRPAWAPPRDEKRGRRLPSIARSVGAIILVIAVFAAGIGIGKVDSAATGSGQGQAATVPGSLPPEFATYAEAWKILQDNFVDPSALDALKLTYGSIDGLVTAVGDTDHTRFLTPDEVKAQHTALSGSIVGIGALMNTASGHPIIQSVIPGGPADRAGLRAGDQVLSVDGVSTDGQDVDTVVKRIRGDAGTTVKITVLHLDETIASEYSIVREKVTVPAVSWAMIPGTTLADLRLEEFSAGSAKEVVTAIKAAKEAGATGMVLDLRGNPGGYVGEAVDIASQFIPSGTVYQQRDRSGKVTEIPVKDGGEATSLPLTVLTDLGTASSAEIVAGAIQDAGRAKLIGEKTFGTGTVLNEFPLKDGSALLVGTIEWLTRNGRQIWKDGIEPDVAVKSDPAGKIVPPSDLPGLGADGLSKSGDLQLLKAIELLKGS